MTKNLCASVNELKNTLKEQDYSFKSFLTDSLSDRVSSTGDSFAIVFEDTPVETLTFSSIVTRYKIHDHPTRISPTIQSYLSNIDKSLADPFQEIIKDFFSAETHMRYKHLLDLRSLIFDQLFDVYSPESDYAKTKWFQLTPDKTPKKGKRFCQPKYFILGSTDYFSLDNTLQENIDRLSYKMKKHFGDLSDFGKSGATDRQATLIFNQTITTLSEILSLRNFIYSEVSYISNGIALNAMTARVNDDHR